MREHLVCTVLREAVGSSASALACGASGVWWKTASRNVKEDRLRCKSCRFRSSCHLTA